MAVDPSIALQVKPVEIADPLQKYAQVQYLKNSMVQNETAQLQQQQLRNTMQTQQRVKDFLGTHENYGDRDATGMRMLKPEKIDELYSIDPDTAKDYQKTQSDAMLRSTQLRKEQAETLLHNWKLQGDKAEMIRQEMVGGLQVFKDVLKQNGGDVTAPENKPTAFAAASAAVEALRPSIRAKLIKAGAMDPNTPEEPFDYHKWTQYAYTKEKLADLLKADLEHKSGSMQLVKGKDGVWHSIDKTTGQDIKTAVPVEEEFGPLVAGQDPVSKEPIFASQNVHTGKIETHREVNPDPNKGGRGITMSEERSTAQYNEMQQANKVLDDLVTAKPAANGQRAVSAVVRAPYQSWLYSIHDDQSFSNHVRSAVANALMSPEEQQFLQAARQFIIAGGHQMNGARITDSQFKLLWQTYIGQPGENDAVLAQKTRARANFLESAKAMAGRGAEALELQRKKDQTDINNAAGTKGPDAQTGGAASGPTKTIRIADPRSKTGFREMEVPVAQPQQPAPAAAPAVPAAPAGGDEFPQEMLQHLPKDGRAMKFNVDGQIQTWRIENGKPVRKE